MNGPLFSETCLYISSTGRPTSFRVCACRMMEMEPGRGVIFAVLPFSGSNFESAEMDKLNADGGGVLVRDEAGESVSPGGVDWP